MWGAIIGGAMGLMGANKQAKAQDRANEANMASFNQYKPYVDANLAGASGALDGVLATGAYDGQTYAGPNQFQLDTANTMGQFGGAMMNAGNNMMANSNQFGANANSLYNQFQGLSEEAKRDRLSTAMDYAANNGSSLVDAAMRDDRRNLEENTLTGININASGTGNMNSSRAGVAEAVANRAYDDRRADVAAGIQDRLIDRSLAQQSQQFIDQGSALNSAGNANQQVMSAYNTGLNTLGEGANFGMNAGNALQGYDQARLNDDRQRFEDARDFEMRQRMNYQSGILGRAPSTNNTAQVNRVDPMQGALGGAMQGFGFQQKYGDQISSAIGNSKVFNPLFGGSGLGGFN
jgi:hypothetical protein